MGLVETGELSVFALFHVTRHDKELVEAKPWTSRSITHPQFSPHTCIHKWGKAQKGVMYSAPKNGRGYETFSLKEGQPCDNTRIRILVNESLK